MEVQGQQGDGHGDDPVGERLDARLAHRFGLLARLGARHRYSAAPESIQRRKASTCSAGQAPSQGMVPAATWSRMAGAWALTSV